MRRRATISLASLFSPVLLALGLYVPLLVLYLAASPAFFEDQWGVRKQLGTVGVVYFALALALFLVGALLGRGLPLRRTLGPGFEEAAGEAQAGPRVERLVHALLLGSIAAYACWFGLGMLRAGGPAPLVRAWLADPEYVKFELLRTVPGVTTLTQLAVAGVPLAFVYGLHRRRRVQLLLAAVFALAALRAVVFSERLALLELVIPVVFILLARRQATVPRVALLAVTLGAAVLLVFAATELRRSFAYTGNFSASRVTARFLGYYLTSENNGFLVVQHYRAATPFASTGQMLWRFPVLGSTRLEEVPGVGTVTLRYPDLFHKDPPVYWYEAFRDNGLNYEYNVFTTPGFLAGDLGWFGLPVVLLLGLYSSALARRARTSPFHRALYAVWAVGLLEFMRIMYFFDTRLLPAYLAFGGLYLSLRRRGRRLQWRLLRESAYGGQEPRGNPATTAR